ncbi:MAG TPA: multiheme c-type cytochrome [Polyangiaceae bacterium]|nr:multiheme c-type cytochrome [Polyangiaceae bacterium]
MSVRVWRYGRSFLLACGLTGLFALGGGCKCTPTPTPNHVTKAPPAVRLYLVSTPAGALEPCGCVKDMLGGVDHLAALIDKDKAQAPHSLVLGAGPTFFMDPVLDERKATQNRWKAEALAASLGDLGLRAWAPGKNDWAAGAEALTKLSDDRIQMLAANVDAAGTKPSATRIYDVGTHRVGVAGVSAPSYKGALPEGVSVRDAKADLQRALAELDKNGAQIKVALVALPRGEALRLAEAVPGFHLMLVGKPADQGEGNDPPTPAVILGKTLVVETPNHLQAVAVVDFFVDDKDLEFEDASGTAAEERRTSLRLSLAELEARLKRLPDNSADRGALQESMRTKKRELEELSRPTPPKDGSFFTYKLVEVRESLGTDSKAAQHLSSYYQRVNEHNREAFKDVPPKPAIAGQASFVGIEKCTTCHAEERAFWDKTGHAKAYETLANQHKQFNLDCVGCHVTGYEQPGGSNVTHVEKFADVQCEVCHGPGSRHVDSPNDKSLLQAVPQKNICASACHHPPHVPQGWNAEENWLKIIGPGHGM